MRRILLSVLCLALAGAPRARSMSLEQRRAYLDWMRQTLPPDPAWSAWQEKTGVLPPDFDALPRHDLLPDPLRFLDGRPVRTVADWAARRAEIGRLLEEYQLGRFPPKPTLDRVVPLSETRGPGWVTRDVRLEFGPGDRATLRVQVTLPDGPGPFPVLIAPNLAGWAPTLIRRGYISAGYAANDFMDDTAGYGALYPDCDFAALPRRAWAVQPVLDYLATLPQVDMQHVALFGYSRDGKMATIAAALDPRIAAVIAGSTGVGGVFSWREGGELNQAESIETTTRMFPTWFAPQLRFFAGREDRLPVDGNLLTAMIAPRACLIEYGQNDEVSNTWGDEQTYHSALAVYQLLGEPDRLGLLRVPGFHGANDPEACIDWLDIQFGRSSRQWNNHLLFPWDWETWRVQSGETVDLAKFPAHPADDLLTAAGGAAIDSVAGWEPKAAAIRRSVDWMLGDEPPLMPPTPLPAFFRRFGPPPGPTEVGAGHVGNPGQTGPDVPAWVISRGGPEFGWLEPEKDQVDSRRIRFGDNVTGDLYFPKNTPAGQRRPAVIWLHGYSYPLGYMWVYRRDLHPILALTHAGYTVLAYDQCGFGSRMAESAPFYDRWPHWSQVGRMVEDVRAAVDALQKDPTVDPQRIAVFGYSLGGMVGLYAAALDPRIQAVVSIDGFTPLRTDTVATGTGGIARFSHERGLLPRLGFFDGHENQVPYDYDGLLGLIAPRPVLVVQPQMARDANPADVHAAVLQARRVYALYGAADRLALDEPRDYARLPAATQDRIIRWLAGVTPPAPNSPPTPPGNPP
jgi:dienelactone hydrolase